MEKLSARAGGGAGVSHSITDSSLWRNGVQVIQHVYQAAQPYGRITGRWIFQSKIWLTSRITMKFCKTKKKRARFQTRWNSRGRQAATVRPQEWEQMFVIQKVPPDLSTELCEDMVVFLAKVEQCVHSGLCKPPHSSSSSFPRTSLVRDHFRKEAT